MNTHHDYFQWVQFRLKIHESEGQEWERLFVSIMTSHDTGFRPIKASQGDGGNDGYQKANGHYYQCYGPEDIQKQTTVKTATSKAKNDFKKLKDNWDSKVKIQKFSFVLNDKYAGVPTEVDDLVREIESENQLESAECFCAVDLENVFMSLPFEQRCRILRSSPPNVEALAYETIDFSPLSKVVQHILRTPPPLVTIGILAAPMPEEKIRFNGLSYKVASLIINGLNQVDAVDDFFSENAEWWKDKLRDIFASWYKIAKDKPRSEVQINRLNQNDLMFFEILNQATPEMPNGTDKEVADLQQAVLVLMAYYFETCDIYDPVPQGWVAN